MVPPDVDWFFERAYDFLEERWGELATWIVTLALFGAFAAAIIWTVSRLS